MNKELGRQILHIIVGAVTVYLIYIGILDPLVLFMILIVGAIASFLSTKIRVPFFGWFLERFERERNLKTFPGIGMIFFFASALLCLKLFPKDIALASLMVLTLGDSTSHLIGKYFGRTKNPLNGNSYKLLEGSFAGLVFGFIGALVFVSPVEAFAASFLAVIVEATQFDLNKKAVDDNLLIPLVAGTAILAIRNKWLMKLAMFIASFWVF